MTWVINIPLFGFKNHLCSPDRRLSGRTTGMDTVAKIEHLFPTQMETQFPSYPTCIDWAVHVPIMENDVRTSAWRVRLCRAKRPIGTACLPTVFVFHFTNLHDVVFQKTLSPNQCHSEHLKSRKLKETSQSSLVWFFDFCRVRSSWEECRLMVFENRVLRRVSVVSGTI